MADLNRGNRPLSPHLQIYRLQLNMLLSIFHRMTGVGLALGAVLVVWWLLAAATSPEYFATVDWLLAAATSPEYFATVDGLLTSWSGLLVLLGMTWALAYHLLNGIRHLVWDIGYGYEMETAERSGVAVVIGSGVLTVLLWLVA